MKNERKERSVTWYVGGEVRERVVDRWGVAGERGWFGEYDTLGYITLVLFTLLYANPLT